MTFQRRDGTVVSFHTECTPGETSRVIFDEKEPPELEMEPCDETEASFNAPSAHERRVR